MEPEDRHVAKTEKPMEKALTTTWIVSAKLTFLFQAVCLYFYLFTTSLSLPLSIYQSLFLHFSRWIFFSLSSCEMGATTLIPDSSGTLPQSPNVAPSLAALASFVKSL